MENKNVLSVGSLLQGGHYRIERHLGSGGFGNTYQVTDTTSGMLMAMKEFYLKGVNDRDADSRSVSVSNDDNKPEFESQKMKFRKEALRLSGLRHPNVVQVYDLFEENGTAYYVMDYVQGESLSARMRNQGHPFTEAEVLNITGQLLDALGTVHAQNIWHLDLKPGNVMAANDGHYVLIDFGASKQFHDVEGHSLSTSTGLCYTPGYAPTEQIAVETNRIGPWTDLYALGATMYNLLTMQTPPSVSAIQDGEGFNFPAGVSTPMQRLVRWLMEPNRKNRPQSVDAVRSFIDKNLVPKEEESVATKMAAQEETVIAEDDDDEYDNSHSNRKLWILLAAGAAIAIAVVLFFALKDNKHPVYDIDDDMEEEVDEVYDDYEDDDMVEEYEEEPVVEDDIYVVADSIAAIPDVDDRPSAREEQQEQKEQLRQDPPRVENVAGDEAPVNVAGQDDKVFDVVESMPQFPGGDSALMQFLSSNIVYPPVAEENGIVGRVVCTFVVERNGSISDVCVVKSVDPSLDKEAVRVLKSMPNWIPGKQNGSPVRVKYTLPITFRLQ